MPYTLVIPAKAGIHTAKLGKQGCLKTGFLPFGKLRASSRGDDHVLRRPSLADDSATPHGQNAVLT